MTVRGGHLEFGGWIIHLQAAVEGDPLGYDAPAAKYDAPGVVYDGGAKPRQWVTIDCQVTQVDAGHGGQLSQIPGVRASLGRLTATLYDPGRVLDPAASPYELLMRPGAGVRLVAVQPGTGATWPLWTGMAEVFTHDLKRGTGQLVASDLVALFTGVHTVWERPAETSLQRLQAVRAVMPNPIPLSFAGAAVALSAARFAGDLWQSVVVNTGEAEQSLIWVDQTGTLRRGETAGLGPPVNATDCDDGVTPLVYTELTSTVDDDLLANLVMTERTNLPHTVDREPLWFSNPTSVSYYGPHTLPQTSLPLPDDAALKVWASKVLALRSTPEAAITGLSATVTDAFPWAARMVPAVVRLSVGSILDVRLTSRGQAGRWITAVAGIRHVIKPQEWEISLDIVDGPQLVENWGYNHAQSLYDSTLYAAHAGAAGPSQAQVEATITRVLQEVAA